MQFRYLALLVACTTCALHSMEKEEDLSKTVLFNTKLQSLDALEKQLQQQREAAQKELAAYQEEKVKKEGSRAVAQLIARHFNAQEQEKSCDEMRTFYEGISTTNDAVERLNTVSGMIREHWEQKDRQNVSHRVAALITAYHQTERSDEESSSEDTRTHSQGWGKTFWWFFGYK